MTNLEIVASEVITRDLLTEEQVEEMIVKFGALPYKTYQEWKYSGYQVKQGSKAIIKTKLWKKVKEKKEKEEDKDTTKFILVNASLFGAEQVEKIAQA